MIAFVAVTENTESIRNQCSGDCFPGVGQDRMPVHLDLEGLSPFDRFFESLPAQDALPASVNSFPSSE
jgi:hypothetical protein